MDDSVGKSWIVFCHGIVAKLTSAAEFSAEDLAKKVPAYGRPQGPLPHLTVQRCRHLKKTRNSLRTSFMDET